MKRAALSILALLLAACRSGNGGAEPSAPRPDALATEEAAEPSPAQAEEGRAEEGRAADTAEEDEPVGTGKLDLSIEGNEAVTTRNLRRAAVDEIGDATNIVRAASEDGDWFGAKGAVDDAAWVMEEVYRAEGFPFVRADYRYAVGYRGESDDEPVWVERASEADERAPTGEVRATIEIDEGPRTMLDRIVFRGSQAFPDDLLTGFFRGRGETVYVESKVNSAIERVRRYYALQGYLDCTAELSELNFEDERTRVSVEVEVREGPQYRVRRATLVGEDLPEAAALAALVDAMEGKPFHPRSQFEVRSQMIELVSDAGFPKVRVAVKETRAEPPEGASWQPVELEFLVDPGPQVVIGAIEVRGARRSRAGTILRKLEFEVGDLYTLEKERRSFERIYRSGLFRVARLSLEHREGPAPDADEDADAADGHWVAIVEVEEAQQRELWFEPGYGTYVGLRLRAGFRHRNIFGTGTGLRIEGGIAQRAGRIEVGFDRDRILGTIFDVDLAGSIDVREEPSFTRREIGTQLALLHEINKNTQATIAYRYRRTDASDVALNVPPDVLNEIEQTVNIASITAGVDLNTSNPRIGSTQGGVHRASIELANEALGGEIDFVRPSVTNTRYWALRDSTSMALSWRTAVIAPIGATDDIPLQERYFNGGETTVRSFTRNALGPKDQNGNPLGGEVWNVFNVELRQRIVGSFRVAAFADAGNLLLNAGDWGFDDMRYGVGIGLRYMLPIGPIRFDFGWNPDKRPDEDQWAAHLAIGYPF